MSLTPPSLVLLTGPTGYIGGRLLRVLEQNGLRVRCFSRTPQYLKERVGTSSEVVGGDVLDPEALAKAMRGVETAFYLIHALGSKGSFEEEDRRGALNFAAAASEAGVKRIIYLGGLGTGDNLSTHLTSRHEVGQILRQSGVPTIEFRASMVIGSGSLSYAMIQALVEKLPIMITPRWVRSLAQPIAIRDLLEYLFEAITVPLNQSEIFEIGGADKASIADIMREYARQRARRLFIIPVPVLTPYLSSLWLGLVTPLYARVGRKLIDSAQVDTVVTDDKAIRTFQVRPVGIRTAIERAIAREEKELAETRWSDALSSAGITPGFGGVVLGSRIIDSREIRVNAPPNLAFAPIRRIGGRAGWYSANWAW